MREAARLTHHAPDTALTRGVRRLAASAKSGPQFTDQVTPVLIGAEFGRNTVESHFEGHVTARRSGTLAWPQPGPSLLW